MKFATKAIHVGQHADPTTGATVPPIYQTSTYTQEAPGKHKGFEYSRTNNPTRQALEQCLAAIEGGQAAACFASGLAATNTVIQALLSAGDSFVAYGDMYGGTYRLLENVFGRWGLAARYTESTDPGALAELVDATTKVVWLETPTNPMLRLLDIRAVAQAVHEKSAKAGGDVRLVVDNTFATPALQQPLALGADLVVHSASKYLAGHCDVIGGAVVGRTADVLAPVRFAQNAAGGIPGPFDCFLTQRGVKTLALRMQAHSDNATRIARWAAQRAEFDSVIYPGLDTHPDCELCKRQMRRPGGMLTLILNGGLDAASAFMSSTKLFSCAESLGGVESLANHPAIMTHAAVPRQRREQLGIVDGLVRLSVGIEDVDDLIADIEQALASL